MKITFRQKLFLPLLLSWACLLGAFSINTLHNRAQRLEERKIQLKNADDMALSIAKEYQTLASRGVISVESAKHEALACIKALRFGSSGYLVVFDRERVLLHPIKADMAGTPTTSVRDGNGRALFVEAIRTAAATGSSFIEYTWARPGAQLPVPKLAHTAHFAPWDWYMMTGLYIDDLDHDFQKDLVEAGIWLTVFGVALTALLLLVVHSVERSVGGDLEDAIQAAHRIAAGDLGAEIRLRSGDQNSLKFAMKSMRDALADVVHQVRVGADLIATATSEIASGNQDLATRTTEQATSLEETATSMTKFALTVKSSAEHASEARILAESAANVANRGGAAVAHVVNTMTAISASSKRIVDITSVIDDIAFQTNILALNAAVEAARAGDQGRGFAVVANEVRGLAHRAATAAKEIKELISDSVARVNKGAALVRDAGSTMQEIVVSAGRVSSVIGAVSELTEEQAVGIEQVSHAVAVMDQATQQNAALVEQAAAASEAMRGQAERLARLVHVFKLNARFASAATSAVTSTEAMPEKRYAHWQQKPS